MIRVATAGGDPGVETELASRLGASPVFDLVLRCVERSEVLALIRAVHVDALLIAGTPSWIDLQIGSEAHANGVRLIALVDSPDGIDRLGRLGATIVQPDASLDELISLCLSDAAPLHPDPAGPRASRGSTIAIWGPKGSPGRSTISLALAHELASRDRSTVLVDADTYGGDLTQMSQLDEELPGLLWATRLAAKEDTTDGSFLQELRRLGGDGPVIIGGLARSELWPDVSLFGWDRLSSSLRSLFNTIVCDVGFCIEPDPSASSAGRNDLARSILSNADHVVACCRGDAVGLRQMLCAWDDLRDIVPKGQIDVVVTRAGEKRAEVEELLEASLGILPVTLVPELSRRRKKRGIVHRVRPYLKPVVRSLPGAA